jgi:hypothetical protein
MASRDHEQVPDLLRKPRRREGVSSITLRIPTPLMNEIDVMLDVRPLRVPRHTWIIEAIYEKFLRERPSSIVDSIERRPL